MSFFAKIKQFFGIGGVKATLNVDDSISKESGTFSGTVELTAKSEQLVKAIKVELEEDWKTGRGDDEVNKQFTLGEVTVGEMVKIGAGEVKKFDFTCNFDLIKSKNDRMADTSKTLAGVGKFLDGEKSQYTVIVSCDIEGALFGGTDSKEVKIV